MFLFIFICNFTCLSDPEKCEPIAATHYCPVHLRAPACNAMVHLARFHLDQCGPFSERKTINRIISENSPHFDMRLAIRCQRARKVNCNDDLWHFFHGSFSPAQTAKHAVDLVFAVWPSFAWLRGMFAIRIDKFFDEDTTAAKWPTDTKPLLLLAGDCRWRRDRIDPIRGGWSASWFDYRGLGAIDASWFWNVILGERTAIVCIFLAKKKRHQGPDRVQSTKEINLQKISNEHWNGLWSLRFGLTGCN